MVAIIYLKMILPLYSITVITAITVQTNYLARGVCAHRRGGSDMRVRAVGFRGDNSQDYTSIGI